MAWTTVQPVMSAAVSEMWTKCVFKLSLIHSQSYDRLKNCLIFPIGTSVFFWFLRINTLSINFKFFNSQKAHPCARPRRLSHHTQKSACRWVEEKKVYSYKNFCVYFTYLPRSRPCADLHEILHEGSSSRRNQPCQSFYLNQIRGFDSVGDRIFGFPIRKWSRR